MSIPTPKVRAPQGKTTPAQTVSAAALLAGATKKGKTSSHLIYTGEAGQEAAARWLELNAQFAETELVQRNTDLLTITHQVKRQFLSLKGGYGRLVALPKDKPIPDACADNVAESANNPAEQSGVEKDASREADSEYTKKGQVR